MGALPNERRDPSIAVHRPQHHVRGHQRSPQETGLAPPPVELTGCCQRRSLWQTCARLSVRHDVVSSPSGKEGNTWSGDLTRASEGLHGSARRQAIDLEPVRLCAASVAGAHFPMRARVGAYAVGHLRGSNQEIVDLTKTSPLSAVPLHAVTVRGPSNFGAGRLPFTAATAVLAGMFGARFVMHRRRHCYQKEIPGFAQGDGWPKLVRALMRHSVANMTSTVLLHDHNSTLRLRIDAARLLGSPENVAKAGAQHEATALAHSASASRLQASASEPSLNTLILSRASEPTKKIGGTEVRDIDLALEPMESPAPVHQSRSPRTSACAGRGVKLNRTSTGKVGTLDTTAHLQPGLEDSRQRRKRSKPPRKLK